MQAQHYLDSKHLGIQVYDLLSRPDMNERERAKIIAEALETVQQNYPDLAYTATKRDLSETELRLMGEIEKTHERIEVLRAEAKETELRLSGEIKETELRLIDKIEMTRGEIKETELRLMGEIEKTRGEIKETELRLMGEIEKTNERIEVLRAETKETELRLSGEIEKTRLEIKDVEFRLTKEMGAQTMKTVSYLTAIMA
ncbi:MAG: hypothetical protein IE928_10910, partial [Gammaproteobacteria bacterium]|nr:hypothetical protein [Gammaproteobacteria bacterium]